MAFTRQNIGSTQTFSRNGAIETSTAPAFQIFNVDASSTQYSLGSSWSISINNTNNTLSFNNNNNSVLTIGSTGIQGITNNSLQLGNNTSEPSLSSFSNGDMVKINGELYIRTA